MNAQRYLRIAAILSVLVLLTMAGDFLALHDIFNDYISPSAFKVVTNQSLSFPAWTKTPLEWQWIEIMFIARLVLVGSIFIVLLRVQKAGTT